MDTQAIDALFTQEYLHQIFPPERANDFFEALFGDVKEGAYDIELAYLGSDSQSLSMELLLKERPGHCLACNLTQGLPNVFSRHPIINIKGLVEAIEAELPNGTKCQDWSLGYTQQKSKGLHAIPLTITLSA